MIINNGYYNIESVCDLFLVRPGDGNKHVYFSVGVNATLRCAVNNTNLAWDVDGLVLDSPVQGPHLNSRGIFQSEPIISSDGVTTSSVIVFDSRELNNNTSLVDDKMIVIVDSIPGPASITYTA